MKAFLVIYKRFVNGSRWLGKRKLDGFDVRRDLIRFKEDVRAPLVVSFAGLSAEDKDFIKKVTMIVKEFEGEVV